MASYGNDDEAMSLLDRMTTEMYGSTNLKEWTATKPLENVDRAALEAVRYRAGMNLISGVFI